MRLSTRYLWWFVYAALLTSVCGLTKTPAPWAGRAAAGTRTDVINLYKPTFRERNWHNLVNAGFDIIDARACADTATTTSVFSLGDIVYLDGVDGQVDLAQADDAGSAKFHGVVVRQIASPLGVEFQSCGRIDNVTDDQGNPLVPGAPYYLSTAVAGKTTSTTPSLNVVLIGTAKTTSILELAAGGGSGAGGGTVDTTVTTAPSGWLAVADGVSMRLTMVPTSTIEVVDFNSEANGIAAPEGQVLSADGTSGTTWTFVDVQGRNVIRVDTFDPTDPEPFGTGVVTIDLSKDGAPTDAIGALVEWSVEHSVGGGYSGQIRPDSSHATWDMGVTCGAAGSQIRCGNKGIAWFESGTQRFQARIDTAGKPDSVNIMRVYGYVTGATVTSKFQNVHFLQTPDEIGDFVLPTTVGAPGDTVYVGDDGVPVGAQAVLVLVYVDDPSSVAGDWVLSMRHPSDPGAGFNQFKCTTEENTAGEAVICERWVGLNSALQFQGWNNSSRSFTNYKAFVTGYAMRNTDPSEVTWVVGSATPMSLGDVVYLDSTANQVALARANTTATARVDGVVVEVLSTDEVKLKSAHLAGETFTITDDAGLALVSGTDYYLSANVSGAVTSALPATHRVLVGRAVDTSTLALQLDRSLSISDMRDVDTTTVPPATGQILRYDGTNWTPGDKEIWFPASGRTAVSGDYAVKGIGSNSMGNFSFRIPFDFNSVVSVHLIGIPAATNAAADIDLNTDYATIGEDAQTHSQSNTAITYNLTANQVAQLDISSVLTSIAAADQVGLFVTHNTIGGALNYLGIRLRYR